MLTFYCLLSLCIATVLFITWAVNACKPPPADLEQPSIEQMPQVLDKYTQRLLDEWTQHGKIIIGVDIDDTILPYKTATERECNSVINTIKDCQAVGAWVIIYTCRNEAGIEEALKYCKSKDLHIDATNRNPPGVKLQYGNTAKPYANIFLDDRGGLGENLERLKECMYRMRAKQWSQRLDSPGSTEF